MPTVSEISDQYVTDVADLDPIRGERWGVKSDGTRLTDWSPDGYAALADLLGTTARTVRAAEPADEMERLGAGFLGDWVQGELDVIEIGERERALSIIVGAPATTRSVFDLMDQSTPEAWETIAARLAAVPDSMTGYRESLQAGLDHGRPAARRQAVAVAQQCATPARNGRGGRSLRNLLAGRRHRQPRAQRG